MLKESVSGSSEARQEPLGCLVVKSELNTIIMLHKSGHTATHSNQGYFKTCNQHSHTVEHSIVIRNAPCDISPPIHFQAPHYNISPLIYHTLCIGPALSLNSLSTSNKVGRPADKARMLQEKKGWDRDRERGGREEEKETEQEGEEKGRGGGRDGEVEGEGEGEGETQLLQHMLTSPSSAVHGHT